VVEAPRRLSSRHKEAGMDAAIEAARAGLTFIAVERQRRGEEAVWRGLMTDGGGCFQCVGF
jgi:hypothetical protein